MTNEANEQNDALIELTNPPQVESRHKIPPLNMRALLLLEKAGSPFTSEAPRLLDPETGRPITMTFDRWLDEKGIVPDKMTAQTHDKLRAEYAKLGIDGKPVFMRKDISAQQMIESFFVLMHQEDANILNILRDKDAFEKQVLEFAGTIPLDELPKIAAEISAQIGRINSAAGNTGAAEKKVTGPTHT